MIQLTSDLGNINYINPDYIAMMECCEHPHNEGLAVRLTLSCGKEIIVEECMRKIKELIQESKKYVRS